MLISSIFIAFATVPITITCSNIKFQLVDREVTLTTQVFFFHEG